ncbi:MAG: hypothetical protein K2X93_23730 [Candidatus Obscuribacterales bacterium]|nr:hypothetical protein [Candidatus Obscuribacterales bacterium]
MANPELPQIAEAVQGGASPPVADPFHDQLNDMCDEQIAKHKIKDKPAAQGAPLEGIGNALLGEPLEQLKPEKMKIIPFETVYNNQLTPGTSRSLVSGDTLDITRQGSQILVMPDRGRLYISPSTGEANFEPGKTEFKKSVDEKSGITTLQFANGDRVAYTSNGLVEIHRGNDNVTFKDRLEGPDRLKQALDKVDDKLTNEESRQLRAMAKYLTTGDMAGMQKVAGELHKNPESMIRVVNAMNAALQGAEIPRMFLRYSSTIDNHGGRTAEFNIGVSHTWAKSSPWTNVIIRTTDNDAPQASANYHGGPFGKRVQLTPEVAGGTIASHIVNPDFMNKQHADVVENPNWKKVKRN